MKTETQKEINDKIIAAMELVHQRLIEYKKQKKTDLVILKDGKIVKVKPK